MDRMLIKDFMEAVEAFEDEQYLLCKIMYHIAPTLAGIKPSSLMTFTNFKRKMSHLWEKNKEEVCTRLGVHYYELNQKSDRVIILFYHQDALADCLAQEEHKLLLEKLGYSETFTLQESLDYLKKQYENSCPHEMGIFLGYPLEDVLAFMEDQGRPSLVSKYWKVYGNLNRALQIFAAYDEARENVILKIIIIYTILISSKANIKLVHRMKIRGAWGLMSILLIGGLDRMEKDYVHIGSKRGHNVKVYTQLPTRFEKVIGAPDGIVLFTGTVSHAMVKVAVKIAKNRNIPIIRSHSSSLKALERELSKLEESAWVS